GGAVAGNDKGDLLANEIRCERRQTIVLTLCPAVFDRDALAFDIPGFGESLAETDEQRPAVGEGRTAKKANHRHLLRAHGQRPPGAADERGEIPPTHAWPSRHWTTCSKAPAESSPRRIHRR